MFAFRELAFSRTIVFGTAILATLFELVFGSFIAYKKANVQDYEEYEKFKSYRKPSEYELVGGINGNGFHSRTVTEVHPGIIQAIVSSCRA